MLRSRIVQVELGGYPLHDEICNTPYGLPLFWLLVMDVNLKSLENNGIRVVEDDIAILVPGLCLSTISRVVQTGLKIVEQWTKDRGLSVKSSKI